MPSHHQIRRAPIGERQERWVPHVPRIVGDASERRIIATANTRAVDRYRTRIEPGGMTITPGPLALLFNHRTDRPAGRIETIARTPDEVTFEAVVLDDEVFGLIRSGQVAGVSIGFRPLDWIEDEADEDVLVCRSWELCEVSIVSVPANPQAVITEVRSLGERIEQEVFVPPLTPPARQDPAAAPPRLVQSIPARAPAVHTARAKPFDVGRVWQSMVENRELDGLEREVTDELEKRSDVPTRGKRLPAALFKRTISTDVGSIGAMSPTAYLGQLLDDVAAVRKWGSLLPRLGFTTITTTRESIAIPKRTQRIAATWGPRDIAAVESEWQARDDTLSPTYIKVTATLERSALKYGDPAALMLTLGDIGDAMDDGADTGLLYGSGQNDEPVGLLTQPGRVVDLAGGSVTSEILMDFKNVFLSTWRMDNPDQSTRWLMNQRSWDALRITSKKAGAGATEEWPSGIAEYMAAEGILFMIPVLQSGKVGEKLPANSNLYDIALIHGRMGVVVWFAGGSVDTIVDAMSLSTRGAVRVSAFLDCNAVARDAQIVHALTNVLARPPAAGAPLKAK